MVATTCRYCGRVLDPAGPAVLLSDNPPYWQPFLEDLRSTSFALAHATCFAQCEGIDSLVSIVTESDRRHRRSEYEAWRRIRELEARDAPPDGATR